MKKLMLIFMLALFSLLLTVFAYADESQDISSYLGEYCDVNNSETTLHIEIDEATIDAVNITMSIFRLGDIEFLGVFNTDRITGTTNIDDESAVSMEIVKTDDGLKLTITQSNWLFMQMGHEYDFVPMAQEP